MKFFVLLAFGVVFFTVFSDAWLTPPDGVEYDESKEEDDDDDEDPKPMSSAMQLNGNNVGDINNIKGRIKSISIELVSDNKHLTVNWNGELHNMMTQDVFSVILRLLNQQQIIEHHDDEDDEDDEWNLLA